MASCTMWWLPSSPQDADLQQTWHSHLLVCQQDPVPLCNMTELYSSLVPLISSGHCGLTEAWCGERNLRMDQPIPAGTRSLWGSADHDSWWKLGKMPSPWAENQLQHGSTALLGVSFHKWEPFLRATFSAVMYARASEIC